MSGTSTIKGERIPFEWHALLLFELSFVLLVVQLAYGVSRSDVAGTLVGAALPLLLVTGTAIWALVVRRWWAPAAAVGLLWAMVVQGSTDLAVGLYNGQLTIPVSAILAGLVLWSDRPRLSDRGRPWAWAWAALGVGVWAFGVLVLRSAWLSANWW